MPLKSLATKMLPPNWKRWLKTKLISFKVRQLQGPRSIRVAENEAVVTCVVKNGGSYVEQFIEHYLGMGFRHVFILDNGSTDDTLSIAGRYKDVSVCQCLLPIDANQANLKRYLATASSQGGWCLDADIDEFLDYPHSDRLSLKDFLGYLNTNKYTAVITQMLDMFSDEPLSHLAETREVEPLKDTYTLFDTIDITRTDYCTSALAQRFGSKNRLPVPNTSLYWGGIRKSLYGNDCLLTKHSLFRIGQGVVLFPHVHFVDGAAIADISCAILHYKLTSEAVRTTKQNREYFTTNSQAYGAFLDVIAGDPDRRIRRETSVRLLSMEQLVKSGFLFASDRFQEFAGQAAAANAEPGGDSVTRLRMAEQL